MVGGDNAGGIARSGWSVYGHRHALPFTNRAAVSYDISGLNYLLEEYRMPEIKGTKTEKNLMDAFAGESQARNKYTYFASVAKKEGYEKIAAIFLETAENEKEHAKLHFKHLCGIGSTADNLKAAAAGETEEFTDMYPRMAREAKEEGFAEIAFLFESIGRIEKHHQERYKKLLDELEAGTLFSRGESVSWKCRNCGHIHEGKEALKICPVCKHPQAYFELVEDHY
jgi:rubrerythrin